MNPLDIIVNGAKSILDKGKSAVASFLNASDNSTTGIIKNTITGIPKATKDVWDVATIPFRKEGWKDIKEGFIEQTPRTVAGIQTGVADVVLPLIHKTGSFVGEKLNLPGQAMEFFSGGKIKAPTFDTQLVNSISNTLRDKSEENLRLQKIIDEEYGLKLTGKESLIQLLTDKKFVAKNLIGGNLPSLVVGSIGGLTSSLVGAPFAGAFLSTGALEGGFAINEARDFLRKSEKPELRKLAEDKDFMRNIGTTVGIINGVLESIPITIALNKTPVGRQLKTKIIKTASNLLLKAIETGGSEAITESLQEITSNAVKKVYDEDQKLFTKEIALAGIGGGILGGGMGISGGVKTQVVQGAQEIYNSTTPKQRQGGYVKVSDTPPTVNVQKKDPIAELNEYTRSGNPEIRQTATDWQSDLSRINPIDQAGNAESMVEALKNKYPELKTPEQKSMFKLKAEVPGMDTETAKILRGTKGMTAEDITKTYPDIQLKREVPATDIYGNKVKISGGEVLTPYELKGNKILLQDGETYIVSKSQYQNIKGNSTSGEASEFAPELKGTEETVMGGKPVNNFDSIKWTGTKDKLAGKLGDREFGIQNEKDGWYVFEKDAMLGRRVANYTDAVEELNRYLAKETPTTKYAGYTLPGGENYKEILIKASTKPKTMDEISIEKYGKPFGEITGREQVGVEGIYYRQPIKRQIGGWDDDGEPVDMEDIVDMTGKEVPSFKSSHWPEDLNVLAHLRMNWRKFQGKLVAFMEELQSDWAREARKYGDILTPDEKLLFKKYSNTKFRELTEAQKREFRQLELKNIKGIPSNPLLKNWQTLAIKRALIEAVNSGAEYFAWITGDQTSARYNLAKQVDLVYWMKDSGGKLITIVPKTGKEISFRMDDSGQIIDGDNVPSDWVGKRVDEVMGKGIAEKISVSNSGKLSDEGLKFGGEWASTLYDKQVKNIVEDLTGGKVEVIDLGLPVDKTKEKWTEIPYGPNPSRPATVETLKVGQTLVRGEDPETFDNVYIVTDILGDGKFKAVQKKAFDDMVERAYDRGYVKTKTPENVIKYYKERPALYLGETFDISTKKSVGQQAIRLTPEIKARIKGEALPIKASGKMFEEAKKPIVKDTGMVYDKGNEEYKISTTKGENLSAREPKDLYNAPLAIKYKKQGSVTFAGQKISEPADVAFAFKELKDEAVEKFFAVGLKDGVPITVECVSVGTLNASLIHPRETFGLLLKSDVNEVYFVHNHPSGNVNPSEEDILITKRLRDVAKNFGIEYKGHVIIDTTKFGFLDNSRQYESFSGYQDNPKFSEFQHHSTAVDPKDVSVYTKYAEWTAEKPSDFVVMSPKDAYELVKGINLDYKKNALALHLNTRSIVITAQVIPKNELAKDLKGTSIFKQATNLQTASIILVNTGLSDIDAKRLSNAFKDYGVEIIDVIEREKVANFERKYTYKSLREGSVLEKGPEYQGKQISPLDRLIAEGKIKIKSKDGKDVYEYLRGNKWMTARDEDSAIKQAQYKRPVKELPPELEQKKMSLEIRKDALASSPLAQLTKYVSKTKGGEFEGKLPEINKTGKSKFAKHGDVIIDNIFDRSGMDSLDVIEQFEKYQERMKEIKAEEKALREEIKEFKNTPVEKPAKPATLPKAEIKELEKMAEQQNVIEEIIVQPQAKKIKTNVFAEPIQELSLWNRLFTQNLNPLRFVDATTRGIFKNWIANVYTSSIRAGKSALEFNKLSDGKAGMDVINAYEVGQPTKYSAEIKKTFDGLLEEARRLGVDMGFRANYLPHVYAQNAKQIDKAINKHLLEKGMTQEEVTAYRNGDKLSKDQVNKLKLTPFFSKARIFATYKEASEYGLTPRYRYVDQLIGYYIQEMESIVSNNGLIENLENAGKILPFEDAPITWDPVQLPFQKKGYMASPNVAKVINNLFGKNEPTIWSYLAKFSKAVQEIKLSAGLPNTDINFFAIGQLYKEVASGNLKAFNAFFRANFNEKSAQWMADNIDYIEKMTRNGLDISNNVGSWESLHDKLSEIDGIVGKGKEIWDRAFSKKTFMSFIPQMQIQLFKDIYTKLTEKGYSMTDAEALATATVANNFGIAPFSGRSKATQDKLSAIFFAPKFREGIINTLYNTGKAGIDFVKTLGGLRSPMDITLDRNRRLIIGMIITYMLYNLLNRKLNDDDNLWDNPTNRKFALRVPLENGDVIYVEYFPSFLAFARNMFSGTMNLVTGDFKGATQKFGSVFSMPIKTTAEIVGNRDYFDREIYKDSDPIGTKALKIAKYAGLSVAHPYITETVNQIQDKKPLYQSIITGLELPLKFSSTEKESMNEYYAQKDIDSAEKAKAKAKVQPKYDKIKKLVEEGKIEEAKKLYSEFTTEDLEVVKSIKTTEKAQATIKGKALMETKYNQIQKMIKDGKKDEAKRTYEALSEKDKEYMQAVIKDKQKDMEAKKEEAERGNIVALYAKAVVTDPSNALKAMFTKEKLDKVQGNAVALQRFYGIDYRDVGGSQEYKRKAMEEMGLDWKTEQGNYKLEHITPVSAGGDNSDKNLVPVTNEEHNLYTPIDIAVGNAVKLGIINRKEATQIMTDLKINKTLKPEEVYLKLK